MNPHIYPLVRKQEKSNKKINKTFFVHILLTLLAYFFYEGAHGKMVTVVGYTNDDMS